jgi:signal transduction histidine kinase
VDGEPHAVAKGLQVDPVRPNVEFRYSAVSLSAPDNVTFRYKLEPLDREWVEPGTRRIAYYSRLPAGNYRFVVTAANRDGVWNSTAAVTELTVLAPLYQRTWFVTALLLLGAFVLWLVHEAVVRTRSAAIRDERSRLAREIHDSLLQGFGGIALELDAASARLALPPQQQRLLDRVLSLIDRTLMQARQAVWDIRPGELTNADIARDCKEACERILGGTSTEWNVELRGRQRRVAVNYHTECVRIVEEALTNVRKHAEARHVNVLIDYTWSHVRITVQDDGLGFDPEQNGARHGHWGLLGMRERASRFGGKFAIESRIGGGTVVTVNAPYGTGLLGRRSSFDKN